VTKLHVELWVGATVSDEGVDKRPEECLCWKMCNNERVLVVFYYRLKHNLQYNKNSYIKTLWLSILYYKLCFRR